MDYCKGRVTELLVDYFGNDFRRITHALEVMKYAGKIMETREDHDYDIVIACSLLHDVGIRTGTRDYGQRKSKSRRYH